MSLLSLLRHKCAYRTHCWTGASTASPLFPSSCWRHETSSTYPEVEPRFIPQRGSSPSFAVGASAVKTSPAQHQLLALEQRGGLLVWSWCWESRAFSSTFPRWRMFREQPRRIGKAQANCGMGAVQVQRAGTVLRDAASKWLEALNATIM